MDGLFFLMSIVGVGLVIYWMVVNDRVAPDQPTTGLFALVETAGRRKRPAGGAGSSGDVRTARPPA